jgi:hypothetical protein
LKTARVLIVDDDAHGRAVLVGRWRARGTSSMPISMAPASAP